MANNQIKRNEVIKEVATLLEKEYGKTTKEKLPRGIDFSTKLDGKTYYFAVSVLTADKNGKLWGATNTSEWKYVKQSEEGRTPIMRFIIVSINPKSGSITNMEILTPKELSKFTTGASSKVTFSAEFNEKGQIIKPKKGVFTKEEIDKLMRVKQ